MQQECSGALQKSYLLGADHVFQTEELFEVDERKLIQLSNHHVSRSQLVHWCSTCYHNALHAHFMRCLYRLQSTANIELNPGWCHRDGVEEDWCHKVLLNIHI